MTNQAKRELFTKREGLNLIESIGGLFPSWNLCDQINLYPLLTKSQLVNYTSVVDKHEAISFQLPARVISEQGVERDVSLLVHFYKFDISTSRYLVKLSYTNPFNNTEVCVSKYQYVLQTLPQLIPDMLADLEEKIGKKIELSTISRDVRADHLTSLRVYSKRLIIYRVGDKNLDILGNVKANSALSLHEILEKVEEVKCALVEKYKGENLHSKHAIEYVTKELTPFLEEIDLNQFNFPFIPQD
ncbi:hypothetical protein VroAM7_50520 (plasmid) [Vibrio rotiferianus]|uniref:Uncharacterized protein n=1 Tax=Vibrio rotiferianus TaxID=190895 RepID=A0A510IFB7_9VIBR|nr:hypothetical protein [Vibrio rotiferianus]BBL92399.1 hypothetical protein VroAM7_50520 [Vibrio rotiferianus]